MVSVLLVVEQFNWNKLHGLSVSSRQISLTGEHENRSLHGSSGLARTCCSLTLQQRMRPFHCSPASKVW